MRNEKEMQNLSASAFAGSSESTIVTATVSGKRRVTKVALAFACLFGGFASSGIGFVLLIFHEIFNDSVLNSIGTVLMIVSIPLILLGSVFMDSVDGSRG